MQVLFCYKTWRMRYSLACSTEKHSSFFKVIFVTKNSIVILQKVLHLEKKYSIIYCVTICETYMDYKD